MLAGALPQGGAASLPALLLATLCPAPPPTEQSKDRRKQAAALLRAPRRLRQRGGKRETPLCNIQALGAWLGAGTRGGSTSPIISTAGNSSGWEGVTTTFKGETSAQL